jgi:hypothetical protein
MRLSLRSTLIKCKPGSSFFTQKQYQNIQTEPFDGNMKSHFSCYPAETFYERIQKANEIQTANKIVLLVERGRLIRVENELFSRQTLRHLPANDFSRCHLWQW